MDQIILWVIVLSLIVIVFWPTNPPSGPHDSY